MHDLRDLDSRLRQGDRERAIARDLGLSRMTVRKYHARAEAAGYLKAEATLPTPEVLTTRLGVMSEAPRPASGVDPYATVVAELDARAQGEGRERRPLRQTELPGWPRVRRSAGRERGAASEHRPYKRGGIWVFS